MAQAVGLLGVRVPLNGSSVVEDAVGIAYRERTEQSRFLGDTEFYRMSSSLSDNAADLQPYDSALLVEMCLLAANVIWDECVAKSILPSEVKGSFYEYEQRIRSNFSQQDSPEHVSRRDIGTGYNPEDTPMFNIVRQTCALLQVLASPEYGLLTNALIFPIENLLLYIESDPTEGSIGIRASKPVGDSAYNDFVHTDGRSFDEYTTAMEDRLSHMGTANSTRYKVGDPLAHVIAPSSETTEHIEIFMPDLEAVKTMDRIPFGIYIDDSSSATREAVEQSALTQLLDIGSQTDPILSQTRLVENFCQEKLRKLLLEQPEGPAAYGNNSTFLAYVLPLLLNSHVNMQQPPTLSELDANGVPRPLRHLSELKPDDSTIASKYANDVAMYRDSYMSLAYQVLIVSYSLAYLFCDICALRRDYSEAAISEQTAARRIARIATDHWLTVANECNRAVAAHTKWAGWTLVQPFEHWEHDLWLAWFIQARLDQNVLGRVTGFMQHSELGHVYVATEWLRTHVPWTSEHIELWEGYLQEKQDVASNIGDETWTAPGTFYTAVQTDALAFWVRNINKRAKTGKPYTSRLNQYGDSLSLTNVVGNLVFARRVSLESRVMKSASSVSSMVDLLTDRLATRQERLAASKLWAPILVSGSATALLALRAQVLRARYVAASTQRLMDTLGVYATTRPWYSDPWDVSSRSSPYPGMVRHLTAATVPQVLVFFARIDAATDTWFASALWHACKLGTSLVQCMLALENTVLNAPRQPGDIPESTYLHQAARIDLDITRRANVVTLCSAQDRLALTLTEPRLVMLGDRPRIVRLRVPQDFMRQLMPPRARRALSVNEVRINGHRLVIDSSIPTRSVMIVDAQQHVGIDQTIAVVEIRSEQCGCWSVERSDCLSYKRRQAMLEHMKADSVVPASEQDVPATTPLMRGIFDQAPNTLKYDRMLADVQRAEHLIPVPPVCHSKNTHEMPHNKFVTPLDVLNDQLINIEVEILVYELWSVDGVDVRVPDAFHAKHTCVLQLTSGPGAHIRVCPLRYKG